MLFKSPGKLLEKSLNKKLGNLYEACIQVLATCDENITLPFIAESCLWAANCFSLHFHSSKD